MGVSTYNNPRWLVICDCCQIGFIVEKNKESYNGAQAARSLGWSFGKDGKAYCKSCRRYNHNDKYKHHK